MNYRFTLKFRYSAWMRTGIGRACARAGAMVGAEATVDAMGICSFMCARQGASARTAMGNVLAEVLHSLPGARLVEAAPDFVGLGEASRYLGISRQAMRKWAVLHGGSFPAAIHGVNGSVWHLVEILEWMQAVGRFNLDPGLLEVARYAAELNLRVALQRHRRTGHRAAAQSKANPEIIVPSTSSE